MEQVSLKEEHQSLIAGDVPGSLQRRIARFHLTDNTRGEPPMWNDNEVRDVQMEIDRGKLPGSVHLETKDGRRGYKAKLLGDIAVKGGRVVQFDVVALGDFLGRRPIHGRSTQGKIPAGGHVLIG